jgi:hypothetical protein
MIDLVPLIGYIRENLTPKAIQVLLCIIKIIVTSLSRSDCLSHIHTSRTGEIKFKHIKKRNI